MIETTRGNMLKAPAEALVNTVNTVGVMGKGIALQFRQAFPEMYRAYEKACKDGDMQLGRVQIFDLGGLVGGPRWIINFPTKGHWRARSRLADVESGLADLVLGFASLASGPLQFRPSVVVMVDWTGTRCVRASNKRLRRCPMCMCFFMNRRERRNRRSCRTEPLAPS